MVFGGCYFDWESHLAMLTFVSVLRDPSKGVWGVGIRIWVGYLQDPALKFLYYCSSPAMCFGSTVIINQPWENEGHVGSPSCSREVLFLRKLTHHSPFLGPATQKNTWKDPRGLFPIPMTYTM